MDLADKSVIVIGAGLAGLSAGCYARMNGYDTRIFEHHSKPGGVVAAWKRGDYLIDGGVHFLMGHKEGLASHEVFRQLGVIPACDVVDMTTYARFTDERAGRTIDITCDLDRLAADMKSMSPADAGMVDRLIQGVRGMQRAGFSDAVFEKPPELTGILDRLKQMWTMRGAYKYFSRPFGESIADYARNAQDDTVRRFLENLFLPEAPVWFIMMILAALADRQLGLLVGGSLDFATAIESRFAGLGGEITYKVTVREIIVEQDRAVGVRLDDGTEHRADAIVSAADGYSTVFQMLGGRYIDAEIKARYDHWQLFRPTVTVSCGVAREFAGEPSGRGIILKSPVRIGSHSISSLWLRIFNYSPRFAPAGKTVIQVMLETEWDYWNGLQKRDRPAYDAEKQRIAREVLDHLEPYYPGLSSQVEATDVSTPYTTWRYTRNWKGSPEGWLPSPKAIMTQIKRTLPGLAGFYMAGQWVMPGGGVVPCLYSGRHVVQILCRNDRRQFVTTAP